LRQFMYFKDVDKQISGLLGVIVSRWFLLSLMNEYLTLL
jgi:hypothetical protein